MKEKYEVRIWGYGYLGISSPIFCVPVSIAEPVQLFKQT